MSDPNANNPYNQPGTNPGGQNQVVVAQPVPGYTNQRQDNSLAPTDYNPEEAQMPQNLHCSNCNSSKQTRVKSSISTPQWLICYIMYILGLWCCCCIPCYIKEIKVYRHFCSGCGQLLRVYDPMNSAKAETQNNI